MSEFDGQLTDRLLAFQRAHGLPATGVASTQTWAALLGTQPDVRIGQKVPTSVPAVAPPEGLPPEGLPPELLRWTKVPGDGFGSSGGAGFGTGSATGQVTAGGTQLGKGTFFPAKPGAIVTNPTNVTVGEVAVGEATVANGNVVSGGVVRWLDKMPPPRRMPAPWHVLVGALVFLGTVYLIVEVQNHLAEPVKPDQEDSPGVSLPGGTGKPAQAPGTPAAPARDPGAQKEPAHAPGGASTPVTAPGIVVDPEECLRLNQQKKWHYHHIFPQQFRFQFTTIGISIDRYTVKMDPEAHITSTGIHSTMCWNDEWKDFFENLPTRMTLSEKTREKWQKKAQRKALQMLEDAGIYEEVVQYPRK